MTPEQKRAFHDRNRETYQKRDRKRRALELSCEIIVPYSRKEIIKRDGSDCYLCGKTLTLDKITLDHVLPLTRNGNDKPENIKIACKSCNSSKSNKTLTEYKKYRGDYKRFKIINQ
jgi:5-methylcytosine-specific restriction endonuclease McrA